MAFKPTTYPAEKPLMYRLLKTQLTALIDGVPYLTANLANASALLNSALKEINWVGFYFLEGDILVLGPFQGNPACVGCAELRSPKMKFSLSKMYMNFRDISPAILPPTRKS